MTRPPPWAYAALQAAAAGFPPDQIAADLKIPLPKVKRVLGSDWATEELRKWNDAVMASVARSRMNPLARFQSLVDKAIAKVDAMMDCGDPKVELAAAQRILDNAGLKPATVITVDEDKALRDLTPDQLEYVRQHGRLPPIGVGTAVAYIAGREAAQDAVDAEASDG